MAEGRLQGLLCEDAENGSFQASCWLFIAVRLTPSGDIPMKGMRSSLRHLGTLRGRGKLMSCDGEQNLGEVTYEIDGFLCGAHRSDNGRIEGGAALLA